MLHLEHFLNSLTLNKNDLSGISWRIVTQKSYTNTLYFIPDSPDYYREGPTNKLVIKFFRNISHRLLSED